MSYDPMANVASMYVYCHILDLICSSGLTLHVLTLTLHLATTLHTDIPTLYPRDKHKISLRNLKYISPSALLASLASKMSVSPPPLSDNPSDLANYYNDKLSSSLDQFPPIKTQTVSVLIDFLVLVFGSLFDDDFCH